MIPRDSIDTSPEHVAALGLARIAAEIQILAGRIRVLQNEAMIDRQVEAVLQATSRPSLRVVRA